MEALKHAFPKSVTMLYANFMPGEWVPDPILASVYAKAKELKIGVGGPDMIPYKAPQMNHSYPLMRANSGVIPTALAVQEGDYLVKDPRTGRLLSVDDIYRFGATYLGLSYIFWCTEEPYYSKALLPFLNRLIHKPAPRVE